MKVKFIYVLVFSFICLTYFSKAQDISSGYLTHTQTNEVVAVYYTVSNYSDRNIFYNQYTIFNNADLKEEDSIFVVYLNFNKNANLIEIRQENKKTGQNNAKTIKFDMLSYSTQQSEATPIYCYKNYAFNDTLLSMNKDNNTSLLFTVADTTEPIIFLHQIMSFDGGYKIELDKFRKSYLTPHLIHANEYWAWQAANSNKRKQDSINNAENIKRRTAIAQMINFENIKIDHDGDSIVTLLSEKLRNLGGMDVRANATSQKLFADTMNMIFRKYFNKIDTLNYVIKGAYKVRSKIDHSLEVTNKIEPITNKIAEFNFKLVLNRIDTSAIKHLYLKNEKKSLYSEDFMQIVINKHNSRSTDLKSQMNYLKISYDSSFYSKLQGIRNVLNAYPKMEEVSTVYEYPFIFESKSEWQKWILKKSNIKYSSDSVIIDSIYINAFKSECPKAKNGKYNVRVNSIFINNYQIGPELDKVGRKYKFMTHFGFSGGTFITPKKHVTGDETYDGNLVYWNLFLIYHHIGAFYGFSKEMVVDSTVIADYREGGIYIAPGNVFYFKLGIANGTSMNSTSIMPLVGASFIFPVFHFEGGYNFALNLPYAMVGFNIPLNR